MPAAVEEGNSSNNANTLDNNNTNGEEDTTKPNMDEKKWQVLKAYIMRDRARKKQEHEAEVEEERLRKEREAREQQDVMTLGETREKIIHFESKLQSLKEEKHLLFLQLKKVLNEDDIRRRQLQKDASDQQQQQQQAMLQSLPPGIISHQSQSVYIQPSPPSRIQTIAQQPSLPPVAYKPSVKRPRSPSSPPSQVAVSLYHQGYTAYKPPTATLSSYQGGLQKDDGRPNELVRAVLWNKASQCASQPSAFYPVTPQDMSFCYSRLARDSGRPVYDQQRPQGFQINHKLPEHYTTIRTPNQYGHAIPPNVRLTITKSQGVPKGGNIAAGYAVRTQPEYQQAGPASLYTTQSRQMYQNYPQGD